MDTVGLRDKLCGQNQLRKAGRTVKVNCTAMRTRRKISYLLIFIIVMITVRFVETLPPTALFPLGHLEFMERELGL